MPGDVLGWAKALGNTLLDLGEDLFNDSGHSPIPFSQAAGWTSLLMRSPSSFSALARS